MKKIIWLDIGTHYGQEFCSVFNSNIFFFYKLIRRFVGTFFFKRGSMVSFSEIRSIFQSRKFLNKFKNYFYFIFVEANPNIFKKLIYSSANESYCISLSSKASSKIRIDKFFIINDDYKGQGILFILKRKM